MRIQWNDELIVLKIEEVMSVLGIDYFPSRAQMDSVLGNASLSNKITKTGGYIYWANRLGINTKKNDTSFGNKYEYILKDILQEKDFEVKKMNTRHSYDLLVNNNIKIDVKASRQLKNGTFSFNLETKEHSCDLFILFCLNNNESICKILIIPSSHIMNVKQISIGLKSKYDKYVDRYDYINVYNDFYKNVLNKL